MHPNYRNCKLKGAKPKLLWINGRWEVTHMVTTDRKKLMDTEIWAYARNVELVGSVMAGMDMADFARAYLDLQ